MKLIATLLMALVAAVALAQPAQPFKIDHTISSSAFGDERTITVYLPPQYYELPQEQYTVTYVLDGHFDPLIDMVAKVIEYNSYMYRFTPTIVVGIHAKNRGWEFSAPDPDDGYEGGRAPELQQHFEQEVFPLVDSLYPRTLPFKTIVGHSAGGAFVLHTLFCGQQQLFDGYVAVSPALRPGEQRTIQQARQRLEAGEQFRKFLYCSTGTVGEREETFGRALDTLQNLLDAHPKHGLLWHRTAFEGTDHWTCVAPTVNDAMLALTRDFRADEKRLYEWAAQRESIKAELAAFYAHARKWYGFAEVPEPAYLARMAWNITDRGYPAQAQEVYDWGLEQYPNNYVLIRQKAKELQRTSQNEAARTWFTKALEVLEQQRATMAEEEYSKQKVYVQKKLDALDD